MPSAFSPAPRTPGLPLPSAFSPAPRTRVRKCSCHSASESSGGARVKRYGPHGISDASCARPPWGRQSRDRLRVLSPCVLGGLKPGRGNGFCELQAFAARRAIYEEGFPTAKLQQTAQMGVLSARSAARPARPGPRRRRAICAISAKGRAADRAAKRLSARWRFVRGANVGVWRPRRSRR